MLHFQIQWQTPQGVALRVGSASRPATAPTKSFADVRALVPRGKTISHLHVDDTCKGQLDSLAALLLELSRCGLLSRAPCVITGSEDIFDRAAVARWSAEMGGRAQFSIAGLDYLVLATNGVFERVEARLKVWLQDAPLDTKQNPSYLVLPGVGIPAVVAAIESRMREIEGRYPEAKATLRELTLVAHGMPGGMQAGLEDKSRQPPPWPNYPYSATGWPIDGSELDARGRGFSLWEKADVMGLARAHYALGARPNPHPVPQGSPQQNELTRSYYLPLNPVTVKGWSSELQRLGRWTDEFTTVYLAGCNVAIDKALGQAFSLALPDAAVKSGLVYQAGLGPGVLHGPILVCRNGTCHWEGTGGARGERERIDPWFLQAYDPGSIATARFFPHMTNTAVAYEYPPEVPAPPDCFLTRMLRRLGWNR